MMFGFNELVLAFHNNTGAFVTKINAMVIDATKTSMGYFLTLWILWEVSLWVREKKEYNIVDLVMITGGIVFCSSIALDNDLASNYIIKPMLNIIQTLPQAVLSIVSSNNGNVFDIIDETLDKLNALSEHINKNGFTSFMNITWQSLILSVLWIILFAVFIFIKFKLAFIFIYSYIFAGLIFTVFPVAMVMASFKETRWLLKNLAKSFVQYALTPFFAAIIVFLPLSFLNDAVNYMTSVDPGIINPIFLFNLLGLCYITHNLLGKASEIPSMIMTGSSGNSINELSQNILSKITPFKGK